MEINTINSPDLVSSLHSDPLRNRPVLFLLLSEEALDPESLVGRLEITKSTFTPRQHTHFYTAANRQSLSVL